MVVSYEDVKLTMRSWLNMGLNRIDLLVVNLYPFERMSAASMQLDKLIEYIDVGGPGMIRAAAKNFKDVAVVVDLADYPSVIKMISKDGFSPEQRLMFAKKAFARTAAYDAAISNYLSNLDMTFPPTLSLQFSNGRMLRYGENPHQQAAVYGSTGIAAAEPLQGKQMSYNNYLDVNAGTSLLAEFNEPAAVIIKHNNPCGVSVGTDILDAYLTAREVDRHLLMDLLFLSTAKSIKCVQMRLTQPLSRLLLRHRLPQKRSM